MPVEGDVVWIFYSTGIVTNDVVVISSLPVHINCACANWHKQVQCLVSSGQSLIWLIQFILISVSEWVVPWKKWRRKIILNDGSQRNLLEVQPQCGGVWIPSGISQIFWWKFLVLRGKCCEAGSQKVKYTWDELRVLRWWWQVRGVLGAPDSPAECWTRDRPGVAPSPGRALGLACPHVGSSRLQAGPPEDSSGQDHQPSASRATLCQGKRTQS